MKCKTVNEISHRLTVIGPSEWVCNEARESVVFRNSRIEHRKYPLPKIFAPQSRDNCSRTGKFRLLFGAVHGTQNPIKGFDRLAEALKIVPQELRENIQLRIFGESGDGYTQNGVEVVFLGPMCERYLVEEYRGADAFAFPSRRETWGQVKSEALACGCPVIAFNETACPEGISHGINGWIANDIKDFADGITFFYDRNRGSRLKGTRHYV